MRSLLRFSLALLGACCALSTSQAFWLHKKDNCAVGPTCESAPVAACAPVQFVAQKQNVESTKYKLQLVRVPHTVTHQQTVLVPMAAPTAAPTGCHGGAGCHGGTAPTGCHGSAPTAGGCRGGAPMASCHGNTATNCQGGNRTATNCNGGNVPYLPFGANYDESVSPNLAKLENRIFNIETKLDLLTESVNNWNEGKGNTKTSLPTIPPLPNGSFKPTPIGSVNPVESDPVLAAARAYKARQSALPTVAIPQIPDVPDTGVTRK